MIAATQASARDGNSCAPPRRQRKADPVAIVAGLQPHEEFARTRGDAHFGPVAELLAQTILQALQRGTHGRDADRRSFARGDDTHAVLASEAGEGVAAQRAIDVLQRRTQRPHLHDLRVVELMREQLGAVVIEDEYCRQRGERDDR